MKTYEEINERIERKKAVVMTAEEIIGYVERKGLEAAAKEVDVVTTATFGPMCSSGCFMNFGHAKPRIRMTQALIDDVEAYCGGHAIERLVAGECLELHALSYGTDDYPLRELRTWFTIKDLPRRPGAPRRTHPAAQAAPADRSGGSPAPCGRLRAYGLQARHPRRGLVVPVNRPPERPGSGARIRVDCPSA